MTGSEAPEAAEAAAGAEATAGSELDALKSAGELVEAVLSTLKSLR